MSPTDKPAADPTLPAVRRGRIAGAARALLCRRPSGAREGESGAAAVEFALVALPFLALVFATLQGALMFFVNAYLETVTEKAGRMILTGNAQTQGLTQSTFADKVCGQIVGLLKCGSLMIDVSTAADFASANVATPTLTYDKNGKVTNNWSFAPGAQGSIVVVRVMYQWPIAVNLMGLNLANLSNKSRLLMSTAVFRNEYY